MAAANVALMVVGPYRHPAALDPAGWSRWASHDNLTVTGVVRPEVRQFGVHRDMANEDELEFEAL